MKVKCAALAHLGMGFTAPKYAAATTANAQLPVPTALAAPSNPRLVVAHPARTGPNTCPTS